MKKNRFITGLCLICIGLSLYLNDLVGNRIKKNYEQKKLDNALNEIVGYKYVDTSDKYMAVLSIPKIKLKRGIYELDDINNNVDSNIMIYKSSTLPDTYPSNVILMAHSGVGNTAYFNRLNELDKDSIVEFYYNHTKYVYKIDNFYYVDKIGEVNLEYNKDKKTIILITCSELDKQLVYIGYLIDEINY